MINWISLATILEFFSDPRERCVHRRTAARETSAKAKILAANEFIELQHARG